MLTITHIEGLIPNSSAIALKAISEDGLSWVLRLKKINKNSRRLLNEYLAAGLAKAIGLNRPRAEVVYVPKGVVPTELENVFSLTSQYGVATKFVHDLIHVFPPDPYEPNQSAFADTNAKHLSSLLCQSHNLSQLYGYFTFANWIQLEDNHKYENLCVDRNNNFVFLDMDAAFGGLDTKISLNQYEYYTISRSAPFLEGIILQYAECETWVERLKNLDSNILDVLFKDLTLIGNIPNQDIETVKSTLFHLIDEFVSALQGSFDDLDKMW